MIKHNCVLKSCFSPTEMGSGTSVSSRQPFCSVAVFWSGHTSQSPIPQQQQRENTQGPCLQWWGRRRCTREWAVNLKESHTGPTPPMTNWAMKSLRQRLPHRTTQSRSFHRYSLASCFKVQVIHFIHSFVHNIWILWKEYFSVTKPRPPFCWIHRLIIPTFKEIKSSTNV